MAEHVLREERLLQTVGGDRELLAEIATLFLQDSVEMVGRLRASVADDDEKALWRAAHWVKGSVANFAAERAVAMAVAVEQICDSDGALAAQESVEQLIAELDRVCEKLRSYC